MLHGLTAAAGNVRQQTNPEYTVDMFLRMYPQFLYSLQRSIVETYVKLAWECVDSKRYGAIWEHAVGLLAAHYCTLHLQSSAEAEAGKEGVLDAARTPGVITSESADGVSYSMETSMLSADLQGWAAYKLTTYGVQFATIARLKGKGGMYIW